MIIYNKDNLKISSFISKIFAGVKTDRNKLIIIENEIIHNMRKIKK